MGYHRAGFDVVGVDNRPQPHYPFAFVQADALEYAAQDLVGWDGFDAIHASPPCQYHSEMQSMNKNQDAHQELIGPTRELLEQTGLPYIIENVAGALDTMHDPFQLCASSFGLGWVRGDGEEFALRRHRLFETNWPIGLVPPCAHQRRSLGIYGDHVRFGRRSSDGELSGGAAIAAASEAMGIDWMNWKELREAIPPAYTEFIGGEMMRHIERRFTRPQLPGLDLFNEGAADAQVPNVERVAGSQRTGSAFEADLESAEDKVADLVGGDLGLRHLDVEVNQDRAGHSSSLRDGDYASIDPSGAGGKGRDGDTFLPSSAPVDFA